MILSVRWILSFCWILSGLCLVMVLKLVFEVKGSTTRGQLVNTLFKDPSFASSDEHVPITDICKMCSKSAPKSEKIQSDFLNRYFRIKINSEGLFTIKSNKKLVRRNNNKTDRSYKLINIKQ